MLTDKQACQQAIFPFMLFLMANRALSCENQYFMDLAMNVVTPMLEWKDGNKSIPRDEKDKAKLLRRLRKVSCEIIDVIVDKRNDMVCGHKFILTVHKLAQKVLDTGFILQPEVIDLFEPFLEIEANQNKNIKGEEINEEDWLAMKRSADKLTEKIFIKINENLEFVKA